MNFQIHSSILSNNHEIKVNSILPHLNVSRGFWCKNYTNVNLVTVYFHFASFFDRKGMQPKRNMNLNEWVKWKNTSYGNETDLSETVMMSATWFTHQEHTPRYLIKFYFE